MPEHQALLGGKPYTTSTAILSPELYEFAGPHIVSTAVTEKYKPSSAFPGRGDLPVVRISNGAIGPTELLRELCSHPEHDLGLTTHWIANTSRGAQIALQAGEADIVLTYERRPEEQAEKEGWSKRVGVFCHDHFVLAGPSSNPADVRVSPAEGNDEPVVDCFRRIADAGAKGSARFHTRHDGSATMHKEHEIWRLACGELPQVFVPPGSGHDVQNGATATATHWYEAIPGTPLEAMRHAIEQGAYMLVDRGTFLTAKRQGWASDMICYAEGGERLLNTAMLLTRPDEDREEVMRLRDWLMGDEAQKVISDHGRDWKGVGLPLFCPRNRPQFAEEDLLSSKYLPAPA